MTLAIVKFEEFLRKADNLRENGVRLRVIGDLRLLPSKLQAVVSAAVLETEDNDKLFLNIAFAYTSRYEFVSTVQQIVTMNMAFNCEISDLLLEKCMQLQSTPGLLLRTSGENRISDFLMWQVNIRFNYIDVSGWLEWS